MPQEQPHIQIHPIKTKFQKDTPQTVDVVVRIKSPVVQTDPALKRPKLNLSLVLDRSGSMSGTKMQEAIAAACYCIDELRDDDYVSIVAFDHVSQIMSPAQPAREKSILKSQIRELFARGSTALHDGWVVGGLEVAKFQDPLAVNRVILITDGEANIGLVNPAALATQAGQLNERGISTSTIGIGEQFNEDLLIRMADAGSGNTWHVVKPEDMRKIFETELNGLIAQFGHSTRLSVSIPHGVGSVTCLNEFERNSDGSYTLPNLTSANDLDVAFRFEVGSTPEGTDITIGDLRLDFVEQKSGESVRMFDSIKVDFVSASEADSAFINPITREAVKLIEMARERARTMERIDRGDYEGASGHMRESISRMMAFSRLHPSASLDDEISSLEEEFRDLMNSNPELARKKMAFRRRNRSFGKF